MKLYLQRDERNRAPTAADEGVKPTWQFQKNKLHRVVDGLYQIERKNRVEEEEKLEDHQTGAAAVGKQHEDWASNVPVDSSPVKRGKKSSKLSVLSQVIYHFSMHSAEISSLTKYMVAKICDTDSVAAALETPQMVHKYPRKVIVNL